MIGALDRRLGAAVRRHGWRSCSSQSGRGRGRGAPSTPSTSPTTSPGVGHGKSVSKPQTGTAPGTVDRSKVQAVEAPGINVATKNSAAENSVASPNPQVPAYAPQPVYYQQYQVPYQYPPHVYPPQPVYQQWQVPPGYAYGQGRGVVVDPRVVDNTVAAPQNTAPANTVQENTVPENTAATQADTVDPRQQQLHAPPQPVYQQYQVPPGYQPPPGYPPQPVYQQQWQQVPGYPYSTPYGVAYYPPQVYPHYGPQYPHPQQQAPGYYPPQQQVQYPYPPAQTPRPQVPPQVPEVPPQVPSQAPQVPQQVPQVSTPVFRPPVVEPPKPPQVETGKASAEPVDAQEAPKSGSSPYGVAYQYPQQVYPYYGYQYPQQYYPYPYAAPPVGLPPPPQVPPVLRPYAPPATPPKPQAEIEKVASTESEVPRPKTPAKILERAASSTEPKKVKKVSEQAKVKATEQKQAQVTEKKKLPEQAKVPEPKKIPEQKQVDVKKVAESPKPTSPKVTLEKPASPKQATKLVEKVQAKPAAVEKPALPKQAAKVVEKVQEQAKPASEQVPKSPSLTLAVKKPQEKSPVPKPPATVPATEEKVPESPKSPSLKLSLKKPASPKQAVQTAEEVVSEPQPEEPGLPSIKRMIAVSKPSADPTTGERPKSPSLRLTLKKPESPKQAQPASTEPEEDAPESPKLSLRLALKQAGSLIKPEEDETEAEVETPAPIIGVGLPFESRLSGRGRGKAIALPDPVAIAAEKKRRQEAAARALAILEGGAGKSQMTANLERRKQRFSDQFVGGASPRRVLVTKKKPLVSGNKKPQPKRVPMEKLKDDPINYVAPEEFMVKGAVLPEFEEAVKGVMHRHFMLDLDPEAAMEEFGTNPDIDDKPPPTLEETLEKLKPQVMAQDGLDEEQWKDAIEDVKKRAPHLESLIRAYAGPKKKSARQKNKELENVVTKLPPFTRPELKDYAKHALRSLQSNPNWDHGSKMTFIKRVATGAKKLS